MPVFLFSSLALCLVIIWLASKLLTGPASRTLRGGTLHKAPRSDQNLPSWDLILLSRLQAFGKARDDSQLPEFFASLYAQLAAALGRPSRTMDLCIVGTNALITRDPKNIQAILAHQFGDFGLGKVRAGGYAPLLLGKGIFSTDGEPWEHSRRMLRPQFAREQLSDLTLENELVQDLIRAMPDADEQGWTSEFDFTPLLFNLTMDSSTAFFLGEGTYCLRRGDHKQFIEAFDRCQMDVSKRLFLGNLYWLHNPKSFQSDLKTVFDWTDARVRKAIEDFEDSLKPRPGAPKSKYSFIRELIQETRDPIELRSQLLSIAMAGRETTASLLSWAFFLLARHPAEYTKIRREILKEFGSKDEGKDITFATLRTCKPLQNLLSEALRLFPPVPYNQRQAFKDTTLPHGGGSNGDQPIQILKDSSILIDIFSMQRDPEYWGADSDDFKPDRWHGRKVGWEFLPFNGGPRICIGQMLALTNAGYYVVKLMQHFDQVATTDIRPAKVHAAIVATNAHGVHVRLHRA